MNSSRTLLLSLPSATAATLLLVAAWVASLATACGSSSSTLREPGGALPPGPTAELPPLGPPAFVHSASGMAFPQELDGFQWMRQQQYDEAGRDVSSHYTHPQGIVLSVYVFPTDAYPQTLADDTRSEFVRAAGELLRRSSAIVTEAKTYWRLDSLRHTGDGLGLQALSFDSPLFYTPTQATELLYVFTVGEWHIKFRATFSRELGKVGRRQVESFVEHVPWPVGGPVI